MLAWDLRLGDCREIMAGLERDSVDAIITDPPYGLEFMGKEWDHGVPGIPFWRDALRVAKPGTHLLAFGGTRTFHRLACALEDAGWEIRDTVMWVYGSGFPKSLDVSKAIDKAAGAEREVIGQSPNWRPAKTNGGAGFDAAVGSGPATMNISVPATEAARQWEGWGTALKPAWEPILVCRKPLEGTVAENVQRYGTGALNIDGCRVETVDNLNGGAYAKEGTARHDGAENWRYKRDGGAGAYEQPAGRWPANLIHDGSQGVLALFPDTGKSTGGRVANISKTSQIYGGGKGLGQDSAPEDVRGDPGYGDSGSAARFFYCAKASKSEREGGNDHPTVKPIALMRYLCKLVTPPGGLVLDPFAGSGSTGLAAEQEGFRFLGIELDAHYCEIARARREVGQTWK